MKYLRLGVYPPAGEVRVAAPLRMAEAVVQQFVVSRLDWIRRKQALIREQQQVSRPELVTGESHLFQGRRYRLAVLEADEHFGVDLRGPDTLELRVPPGSGPGLRAAVLEHWYRRHLHEQVPPLLATWELRIGRPVAEWRIRKMKTRWGSCNSAAARIWLSLELAKHPPACLEYVLVHELVHLLERGHGPRFRRLMDGFLPGWRELRAELNGRGAGTPVSDSR